MLVKICGLKTEEMMTAALKAGADFIGLVFFEKSPRHVSLDEAARLAEFARQTSGVPVKIVALMVNPDDAAIKAVAARVAPDYLQLHGAESPARVAEIAGRFNLPLIKAIGVASRADARQADAYDMAEIILFDAKADPQISSLPGGNGIAFDWTALKGQKETRRFMLSGGLTPQNVAEAIRLTGAAMVDVSSGVERAPGEKDAALITAFIKAAKAAGANEAAG